MKSFSTNRSGFMIIILVTVTITEAAGPGSSCLQDEGSPCDASLVCHEGVCKQTSAGKCTKSEDCMEGLFCFKERCICPEPSTPHRKCGQVLGGSCFASEECPRNGVCRDKMCMCSEAAAVDVNFSNCLRIGRASGAWTPHHLRWSLQGLLGLVATLAWLVASH